MTDPDPAAVQIAAEELGQLDGTWDAARDVVVALARRFAFIPHAELAALRAVADAAQLVIDPGVDDDEESYRRAWGLEESLAALDALPPATAAPSGSRRAGRRRAR